MPTLQYTNTDLDHLQDYLDAINVTAEAVEAHKEAEAKIPGATAELENIRVGVEAKIAAIPVPDKEKFAALVAACESAEAADVPRKSWNSRFDPVSDPEGYDRHLVHRDALHAVSEEINVQREYDTRVADLRAQIRKQEWALSGLQQAAKKAAEAVEQAQAKESSLLHCLPSCLRDLPIADREFLSDGGNYEPMEWEIPDTGRTLAEVSAMFRGEIEFVCRGGCHAGHFHHHYQVGRHQVEYLHADLEPVHPGCAAFAERGPINTDEIDALIPPRFRQHTSHNLKPSRESALPIAHQQKIISSIPLDDLKGWLLSGPESTSKTTLAAAGFKDLLTHRRMIRPEAKHLCAWSIVAHRWMDATEKWVHRDFEDQRIKEPEVTAEIIESTCEETDLTPILWIEEIDKLTMTAPRRRYLFTLVNAVYNLDGMVIATTNQTPAKLKAHLDTDDYPIYRRIAGRKDAPGYVVWDFWTMIPSEKGGKK